MYKRILLLIFAFAFSAYSQGLKFEYKAVPRIVSAKGVYNSVFYIFYNNPEDARVSGCIFNLMGMKIANFKNEGDTGILLFDDPDAFGGAKEWEGRLIWEPRNIPSGIYIWQVEVGNRIYTGTVVVAK